MMFFKCLAGAIATMAFVLWFILSGGIFYFFGDYGFGGVHYECGNIDFRLSYDGYSAYINGHYLSHDNWRLINDDNFHINKHYWVGSTHSYTTVQTDDSSSIDTYVDGRKCELFGE